ncbi:MAG: hypothetical protein IPO64_13295 [Bacteroidetes bacterium]|nr:hypothetical protein [Bacteroidota bacterium]
MKYKLILFIYFLFSLTGIWAQNILNSDKNISKIEQKIDSLDREILNIQAEIAYLQDSIIEILAEEQIKKSHDINNGKGIEVITKVENDFGPFKLYETLGKNEIGKIPIGSKIIIYGKVENYYKVGYKNKIGFIQAYYLKLDTEIKSLFDAPEDIKLSKSNNLNSTKSLNFNSSTFKSKDIHVEGHYRTTKSGKTVYVKPHTRSRSKN